MARNNARSKKIPFVVLRWQDSAIHGRDQMSREETKQLGLIHCFSAGFVVSEDKKQITLAMDYFDFGGCVSANRLLPEGRNHEDVAKNH